MRINIKDAPNQKLFVTGCLHLNHNPSWETPLHKMRGYDSSLEMTEDIISTINKTCRESDILLVLGDFCLNTPLEKFYSDVERINPKLWFIDGNHNAPHQKAVENEVFSADVDMLGPYIEMVWNKQLVVANHYAFQVWNSSHHGSWSLCSHSHGSLNTILPDFANGKQLDCGWDVHKKPLSFEEIKEIMDKKSISMPDHHNKETT